VRLVIHPDAEADIVEAADWYDRRSIGLGDELVAEVEAALASILDRPATWPLWPGLSGLRPPVQRYLLSRFHFYGVAYQHYRGHVAVLALVHASRRPFYWLKRSP
jgi:plasmid stabilization system protein ParE